MYKPIQHGESLEPTKVPTELDVAFFAGFYDGEGSVAKRAQMDEHEKYLESKAFFRANNIERLRIEDREAKRGKYVPKNLKPAAEVIQ